MQPSCFLFSEYVFSQGGGAYNIFLMNKENPQEQLSDLLQQLENSKKEKSDRVLSAVKDLNSNNAIIDTRRLVLQMIIQHSKTESPDDSESLHLMQIFDIFNVA